jgi:tryptophanyl-tRNA synthetase
MYKRVFPEPRAKVGRVARLVGIDGRAKMSKSLDNAIYLSDSAERVRAKVRRMITDLTGQNPRMKATDPGIVENNPVFLYHDAFNADRAEVEELKTRYRTGRVSDGEVKESLATALNKFLDPIRERRAQFESRLDDVKDALVSGSRREKKLAQETMWEVRQALQVIYT